MRIIMVMKSHVIGCTQTSASSATVALIDMNVLHWERIVHGAVENLMNARRLDLAVESCLDDVHIHKKYIYVLK